MPQQPYATIFPDSDEPVLILSLDRKQGRIPKGDYGFLELYCTDKGCDCRRVTIFVLNKKMETKAVIGMSFDPDEPLAGPFLDDTHKQSSYANELLQCFVDMINEEPDNLEMMHRHYREVRKKVEGKAYKGKAFPKPGTIVRSINQPPPIEESFMELLTAAATAGKMQPPAHLNGTSSPDKKKKPGLASFVERYHDIQETEKYADHSELLHELRRYLLNNDGFADELASLLVELCTTSTDEIIDAALRLLFDTLETLRIELERKRAHATERMEQLQTALAKHVFLDYGDADLCASVSHVLLQSRIELLPVLHEANSRRLLMVAENADEAGIPAENALEGLFESIREMAGDSPFEALEGLLQLLALSPAEMQATLCAEMLDAESPLIRDMSALMLLHPSPEVRLAVSGLLADRAGNITPETLRRLIISRNWFPEEIRANIDATVSNARRSRIECAPLPRSLATKVYASPVDGAAAQSFQIIVPDGKGFKSCSILLKRGEGVADAFVIPLSTKREMNEFLSMMNQEGAFIESSADYLDQRVCHALAEGISLGKAPNYWLMQVAEILGKDQWKAVPFDALRELGALQVEMESGTPELLAEKTRNKALKDSGDWCSQHAFAYSWYEDDAEVDRVIKAALKKKGAKKHSTELAAIDAIFDEILEKRRSAWLDRLTLCTLWLKSSRKPPIPWHKMYHVTRAIADNSLKLVQIPLMENVAGHSLGAYLARMAEDRC
jgi:hypothetical protein